MKHILIDEIVIPKPESYKDCIELIRSDYYRYTGRDAPFLTMFLRTIKDHCFAYNFWLRLSAYEGWAHFLCKAIHFYQYEKYGIQISEKMNLGYGLYIGHGFGIIINGLTTIGNNVNISQFLTIGTNENRPATIGDNVYIGPSVCIVEDVKIGNNTTIGAGAVVVKDVPENATVGGVPAKIISYNTPARYILRKYNYNK